MDIEIILLLLVQKKTQEFNVQNLYKACKETKIILLKYYNDLFLSTPNNQYNLPQYMPEDLCLFKDNKLVLETISHEFIAQLCINDSYEEDNTMYYKISNYSEWKKISNKNSFHFNIAVPTGTLKTYEVDLENIVSEKDQDKSLKEFLEICLELSSNFSFLNGCTNKKTFFVEDQQFYQETKDIQKTKEMLSENIPDFLYPYYKISSFKKYWYREFIEYSYPPIYFLIDIFTSQINEKSFNFLFYYLKNLLKKDFPQKESFPRSLCFFTKNDDLLFGTSSLDGTCHLIIRDHSTKEKFKNISILKEIPYFIPEDFGL